MTVNIQPLFEPTQLTNADATYYTAAVQTRIDKMTVFNPTAAVHNVTIHWVPAGGAPTDANIIGGKARPLQPGENFDVWGFIGHVMGVGDFISAKADAGAALNFFASGTLVSQ